MDANKNYYETLGVSEDAEPAAIKKAYRKLAMKHHPDKGGDEIKFKEINEANDILTSDKRAEYDHIRKYGGPQAFGGEQGPFVWSTGSGPVNINIEEVFGQVFRGGPFRQQHQQRNRDVHIQIAITLEEAYNGINKRLEYRTSNELKTIDVTIPRGVINDTTLRMRGLGDNAMPNIEPGDLLVTVNIYNHNTYQRSGQNLFTVIELNCFEAMLGAEKILPTITGGELKVKIPAGSQPDSKLLLKQQGMPIMDSNLYGDLFVQLNVSIPKHLTTDQKNLIQDLLKLS
jgi:curved DNA-binding protein